MVSVDGFRLVMGGGMGFGVDDVSVDDFVDVAEVGCPCELFHAFFSV